MHQLSYTAEELRLRRLARLNAPTPTDAAAAAATRAKGIDWTGPLRSLASRLRRREPTLAPRLPVKARQG